MAGPTGALASTYKITRALQMASLVAIIGMTANFVSEMISANTTPPQILIGTLSIVSAAPLLQKRMVNRHQVCIAVMYCAITVILFFDSILPYLINTVVDGMFLIALTVVSVIVGKPVSYLNCQVLDDLSNTSSSAIDFTSALGSSLKDGGKIDYSKWISTSKSTCLEIKSIWGLSIALW